MNNPSPEDPFEPEIAAVRMSFAAPRPLVLIFFASGITFPSAGAVSIFMQCAGNDSASDSYFIVVTPGEQEQVPNHCQGLDEEVSRQIYY